MIGPWHVYLSWGRTADHVLDGWHAEFYTDLEVSYGPDYDPLAAEVAGVELDHRTHCAGHMERGHRTAREMLAMRDWLRSCVEVAGEAGLRALNERTGGRLA